MNVKNTDLIIEHQIISMNLKNIMFTVHAVGGGYILRRDGSFKNDSFKINESFQRMN